MTLADIAKVFKIAPTTASVCISGKEAVYGVRKELAEAVRAYAREHGYAPNRAASRLRSSSADAPIGIVFTNENGIAKAFAPIRAIIQFLDSIHREYLLMGLQGDRIGATMTTLRSMGVRDVVVLGLCMESSPYPEDAEFTREYLADWRVVETLLNAGMRLYTVDYRFPVPERHITKNMTRVGFNIEKMCGQVLLKMVNAGLAPVFFIPWFQMTGAFDKKLLNGKNVIFRNYPLQTEKLFEFGDKLAADILELRRTRPVRSAFIGNDYIAAGVVKGLLARGVSVPEEFGVIGFGNCNTAAYFTRALTTVGSACGEKALELVQSLCGKAPEFPPETELEYKIFERESLIFPKKLSQSQGEKKMKVSISPDKKTMGKKAAAVGAEFIRKAIAERGQANIILACAPSQNQTYDALVEEPGIDWSKVNVFHLDEYVGLTATHPASFRLNLHKTILDRLPQKPMAFHPIEGDAADVQAMIDELDKEIKKVTIDVAFVGIGENGHVAFNDPPADFEIDKAYLVANLDEVCRHQQYGEGWFPTMEAVPKTAVTMSCRQIMRSAAIVNTVPDTRKAKAVALALEGPITNMVPATIMRNHANYFVFLDKEAAALLKGKYE